MLSPASLWWGIAAFATKGIAQGRMVAFAQTRLRFSERIECVCQGGVDPDFRRIGLGSSLLEWQIAAARSMLERNEDNGQRAIVSFVENWQDELENALKARGFHWEQMCIRDRCGHAPRSVVLRPEAARSMKSCDQSIKQLHVFKSLLL